jgi:futalosine hydrolase
MQTLVVAATAAEIAPLEALLRSRPNVDILVTGVGMVAAAARCADRLSRARYGFALNVGLCGSFDAALPPGTVVQVVSDRLPELGAEDGDAFLPIESLDLPADHFVENTHPPRNAALERLPRVAGITVNTIHGNAASISAVVGRCSPQVESMEGAAFMYACRLAAIPYAQVRAVSNVVERRNRAGWKVNEAIDALAAAALRILEHA